jgi:hypothetical protein
MSYASERDAKRRGTKLFIDAHPLTLALIPSIRTKTASGGFVLSDGPPRVAEVMRLIEQASAYGNSPGLLPAQDGKQRRVRFQLLAEWFVTLAVGDHWLDETGTRLEVVELLPYNDYERRGQVVSYG